MFGYIKSYEPQLKIYEYEIYGAVLSGLADTVKKNYGSSYNYLLCGDFALLGLFEFALSDVVFETEIRKDRKNPFKKTPRLSGKTASDGLSFAAAAFVLLTYSYQKSKYRGKRTSGIKPLLSKRGYRSAKEKYPEFAEYIEQQFSFALKLKSEKCKSADRFSEPFANIFGKTLSLLSEEEAVKAKLFKTGFMLGRYVCFAFLADNVHSDFRKNIFNPFALGNPVVNDPDYEAIRKKAEDSVNYTLSSLADCYVELEFERFRPIIDNIIYLGLKRRFYEILNK